MTHGEAMKAIADEMFEERAAIREFDGGMDRDLAEIWAANDVKRWTERLKKEEAE